MERVIFLFAVLCQYGTFNGKFKTRLIKKLSVRIYDLKWVS